MGIQLKGGGGGFGNHNSSKRNQGSFNGGEI